MESLLSSTPLYLDNIVLCVSLFRQLAIKALNDRLNATADNELGEESHWPGLVDEDDTSQTNASSGSLPPTVTPPNHNPPPVTAAEQSKIPVHNITITTTSTSS